jgi:hypothetical protein
MSDAKYMEAAQKLSAEIEGLYARIDDAVRDRIYAAAAEISGVPTGVLQHSLMVRCSSGYCRCRAIRNIVAGEDGL